MFIQTLATITTTQHEHARDTSAHGLVSLLHLLKTLQKVQTIYIVELAYVVRGSEWVCLEVKGDSLA